MDNNLAAQLRQILSAHKTEIESLKREMDGLRAATRAAVSSPQAQIDMIPGRRVAYHLVGSQLFTTTQDGLRASPINMAVSQDGPFVMTHYPIVMWRTTLPTNATDFGRWSPIYSWPLPSQEDHKASADNVINISYELIDAGSQRQLQNEAVPPLLSTPEYLHPCPIPTLFAPNTTVQFVPTYEDIDLGGSTATTEGRLVVAIPGFKIVQM